MYASSWVELSHTPPDMIPATYLDEVEPPPATIPPLSILLATQSVKTASDICTVPDESFALGLN